MRPASEGHEAIDQRARGADLGVQIEAGAEAEQDLARVLVIRDPRIAESAEQDRRGRVADLGLELRRERRSVTEIAVCAEVQRPQIEPNSAAIPRPFEEPAAFAQHLRTDAVAGYEADSVGLVPCVSHCTSPTARSTRSQTSAATLSLEGSSPAARSERSSVGMPSSSRSWARVFDSPSRATAMQPGKARALSGA